MLAVELGLLVQVSATCSDFVSQLSLLEDRQRLCSLASTHSTLDAETC